MCFGVSGAVILSVAVDMVVGMETTAAIDFEFIVEVADAVVVLTGTKIGGAPVIDTGVNANDLPSLTIALEFALPSPIEEPFLCC